MKLPKIQSLNKNQPIPDLSNQNAKILPPISKPPQYQQYILKPSKVRNINKPLLQGGISGEKISISHPIISKGSNIENQMHYRGEDLLNQRVNQIIKKSNHKRFQENSPLQGKLTKLQEGLVGE